MKLTDDTIERAVEKMTDRLDARFMADGSTMTQAEYDAEIGKINAWADAQWRQLEAERRAALRPRLPITEIDDGMGGIYRPGVIIALPMKLKD